MPRISTTISFILVNNYSISQRNARRADNIAPLGASLKSRFHIQPIPSMIRIRAIILALNTIEHG